MKKLIILFIITIVPFTIKAQTLEETMDYINATSLIYVFPDQYFATQCADNYFQFTKETLDNQASKAERIYLKDIKAISYSAKTDFYQIVVMGKGTSYSLNNGELKLIDIKIMQSSINLNIHTPEENIKKLIKAMKHAAELGGAKLINEDLFKD